MSTHRLCTKCKTEKDINDFYFVKYGTKGNHMKQCKTCVIEKQKISKNDNHNKLKREYRKNRQPFFKAITKNKTKNSLLKFKFNISIADYENMLISQNNSCYICKKHKDELKRDLAVDHDHKTGKIRGLLCMSCNTGIGFLQDNIEILQKAIEYLTKFK